jgi:hypothetical protein
MLLVAKDQEETHLFAEVLDFNLGKSSSVSQPFYVFINVPVL